MVKYTWTDADGDRFRVWIGGRFPHRVIYISSDSMIALTPSMVRALAADLLAFADSAEQNQVASE